jgi:hypothetical protein
MARNFILHSIGWCLKAFCFERCAARWPFPRLQFCYGVIAVANHYLQDLFAAASLLLCQCLTLLLLLLNTLNIQPQEISMIGLAPPSHIIIYHITASAAPGWLSAPLDLDEVPWIFPHHREEASHSFVIVAKQAKSTLYRYAITS